MYYEEIRNAVLDGKPRLVEKKIREALADGLDPQEILEQGLLSAAGFIEDSDSDDESQVMLTLSSAKAMKKGMDCIEKELGGKLYTQETAILIGTASGDLHDVGKNVVALYFRGAGFRVIDLGVDVSAGRFVKTLQEHPEVEIVCVSSLLKTAQAEIRHIMQAIRGSMKNRELFLMVGGGAVTEEEALSCGADCYTDNAAAAVKAARDYISLRNEREGL